MHFILLFEHRNLWEANYKFLSRSGIHVPSLIQFTFPVLALIFREMEHDEKMFYLPALISFPVTTVLYFYTRHHRMTNYFAFSSLVYNSFCVTL